MGLENTYRTDSIRFKNLKTIWSQSGAWQKILLRPISCSGRRGSGGGRGGGPFEPKWRDGRTAIWVWFSSLIPIWVHCHLRDFKMSILKSTVT